MRKVLLAVLSVFALLLVAACTPGPDSISLSETELELEVGETATVTATVEPERANQEVEWSSDNENVVTVDDGEVTAVAGGTATITVTAVADDEVTATISVTVIPDPESISVDIDDVWLEVGDSVTVTATINPADAVQEVTWSSADTGVATVDNGVITAVAPGETTITVTAVRDDGVTETVSVTVRVELMTVQEVLDAAEGDEVNAIGVITRITNHRTFFIQDATGAIAVYAPQDTVDALSVGDEVQLFGERGVFNGLLQITNVVGYEILDSDVALPEPSDITDVDASDDAAMLDYQGHRVILRGYLIESISTDDFDNITVELWSPFDDVYLNIRYDSRLGHDDEAAWLLEQEEGDLIDITGMILGWFHGPQLLFTHRDEISESEMSLEVEIVTEETVSVVHDREIELEWTVSPSGIVGQDVTFESADEAIATVDAAGKVHGVTPGTVVITITSVEHPDVSVDVTVTVTRVTIQLDLVQDLRVTEERQLNWTVVDGDYPHQDVTITVDNENILTVDAEGLITAHAVGGTNIVITSDFDPEVSRTLFVTVGRLGVTLPEVTYDATFFVYRLDLATTQEYPLEWQVGPEREDFDFNQDVTFEIESGADYITIDEATGVITGDAAGEAVVIITSDADPGSSIELVITVEPIEEMLFSFDLFEINVGTEEDPEMAYILELVYTQDFQLEWLLGGNFNDGVGIDQSLTFVLTLETTDGTAEYYLTVDENGLVSAADEDPDGFITAIMGEAYNDETAQVKITAISELDAQFTADIYVTVVKPAPEIQLIPEFQVEEGDETFSVLDQVFAFDYLDGDITNLLQVIDTGGFDVDIPGDYTVTFSVTNTSGVTTERSRLITVVPEGEELIIYPTGFYNYQFASIELRHTFFAHAERYLMETMYGGIPMYANAGYALYSERLILPSDDYLPVMGYGNAFGEFTADDSTVLMEDGQPGQVGRYTYRHVVTSNPDTLLHWIYQDSVTSDMMYFFLGAPYYFYFNPEMTGYDVLPSMASDVPQPIDPELDPEGRELSRTWQIPLREDLMWSYHPDTDTSNFPAGHDEINAHDFIETYKLALSENWFRAITGGGDFTSAPQEIVNAQRFADGEVDFDEVGLRAVDDYTLEFDFVGDMSEWSVTYWMASFTMGPINLALYDEIGDAYGTSAETTAYSGAYIINYYEPDVIVRMTENPNFHDPDRFFYTDHTFRIIEDDAIRFQEFLAGTLEAAAVPGAQFEQYQNHPQLRFIPGATTFRMTINSLGTVEAQQAQFPGSAFVPEPLLAHPEMREAFYWATDRQTITSDVMVTNTPMMYYFSQAYVVDAELGIPFRDTEWGEWVGTGLGRDTYGFNEDLAASIFNDVITDFVNGNVEGFDPLYTGGTAENPIEINLQFTFQAGVDTLVAFGEFLNDEYSRILYSEDHHVYVSLTLDPVAFPDNYFQRILIGNTDLGMGGIAGSTLDASSFLSIFADDRRSMFVMDWGIDTSTPNIPITYTRPGEDDPVTEMWSFNAIHRVLNGEVYVSGGAEATPPEEITD